MESDSAKLIICEYSAYPGPRYCNQGDASGEDFYHTVLNNKFAEVFQKIGRLIIDLDGTAGYLSSFLDEAFGNLVYDFSIENVKSNISFISKQEPDWINMIVDEVFVDWELRRLADQVPKKTIAHNAWFRLVNNKLVEKVWI